MPKGKGLKLKDALDHHKGVDHRLEKQKREQKAALKRKRKQSDFAQEDGGREDETELNFHTPKSSTDKLTPRNKRQRKDEDAGVEDSQLNSPGSEDWETADEALEQRYDLSALQDSDSSEDEDDMNNGRGVEPKTLSKGHATIGLPADGRSGKDANEDEDGEEAEEDIPLSDLDSVASADKEDIVPHQRLTINNTAALTKAYESIALPDSLPFSATQAVLSSAPTEIPDIEDDLGRELAFYKQSLEAVTKARGLLKTEGIPFSRPADYFAEMVKSEEHMGKIKKKLVDDAASKKAAAEARRQRDLKKFGKQVQIAKLQERDKAKRDTLDKIKMMKKKRSGASIANANEDDMFDVALEDAAETARKDKDAKRAKGNDRSNPKRQRKDSKYGFGGKKRHAKSNDALSSADTRAFSVRKMKGKGGSKNRPGKSRRANM